MSNKKKHCNSCIYKVDDECTNNDFLFKGDNSRRPYCKWYAEHKQTNAERIRSMTDEELTDFLDKLQNQERDDWQTVGCFHCVYYGTHHAPVECTGCEFENGISGWLKLEANKI